MIETDHDMRNPADMIILERVAKAIFHTSGIALVQSITRPLGTPMDHSSIPFQISAQSAGQIMNLKYQQDRGADILKQADEITKTIDDSAAADTLQQAVAAATAEQTQAFHETVATVTDLRDKIANFDDFFRPLRNYFYWEPHCFDIPMCAALQIRLRLHSTESPAHRSIRKDHGEFGQTGCAPAATAGTAAAPDRHPGDQSGPDAVQLRHHVRDQRADARLRSETRPPWGRRSTPPRTTTPSTCHRRRSTTPNFKRGLKLFLSPDGKAARMIITHEGDPATPEGISHIDSIKNSAYEAIKATPLLGAKIYIAGTASTYKDIQDGAKYDLLIAGMAALSLILLIMMFITRSLVAAMVIVGTVALSLGASFGLSVLVWQDIFGIQLYWIVLALAVILLLAVGSDYNLLLISRFREEIGAGLKTGIIRAMAGTGGVVTAAGLVFAATMASFMFSDLRVLGQIGTTIGLGLLFDTLIVRSFMTPSIAALLGRWFWWPQSAPPPGQPDAASLRITPAVRQLLLWEDEDPAVTSELTPALNHDVENRMLVGNIRNGTNHGVAVAAPARAAVPISPISLTATGLRCE